MITFKIQIYDGKKKRKLEFEDLWVIYHLRLPCITRRKRKWWQFRGSKASEGIVYRMFEALDAALKIKPQYPAAWMSCINVVDNSDVAYVKCPTLHKHKTNRLVRMLRQLWP